MKKGVLTFEKVAFIALVFVPFLICWIAYYEPYTLTTGSKQVSTLLFFILISVCYYFCHRLDGFRVTFVQIRDLILGQVLAIAITDALAYVLIWMLSIHMPNLIPGLICFAAQCGISAAWSYIVHRDFFAKNDSLKSVVVFDERRGLDELIGEYGLEKRFEIIGTYRIEEIIDKLDLLSSADAVFLCGISSHERNIILKHCTYNDINLYLMPTIGDAMMSGAERLHMLHLPILKCQRYNPGIEYLLIKRLMDVVFSGIALIITSPVFLVTAIAIKSDGGPVFYKQTRLTKDGKTFEVIKFRSMCVDAEKLSGAILSAGEDDPRITKVGKKIRAYRIDELPQLLNIIKGEMSIVGPRPERPEIEAEIVKELPEFALRLQTKAGLTGYAQVYGKYNTTFYDKLLMDLMYISKPSILEDFVIMIATLKILFAKESTEGIGEEAKVLKSRD